MANTAFIPVPEKNPLKALQAFFQSILEKEEIQAILVPMHLPMKDVVMPTLITDPARMVDVDPLAPSFPLNAARIVSRLTRKSAGGKIAAVLRSCEIRAFIELVKLKQGRLEDLVIIGLDCPGAYTNRDYARIAGEDRPAFSLEFCRQVLAGKGSRTGDADIARACLACEHPIPEQADLLIGMVGIDFQEKLLIQSRTAAGDDLFSLLNLQTEPEPEERQAAVESFIAERKAYRDRMLEETQEITGSLEKLTAYLAGCVNCYNCRVACPVCYCKECVFATDVFYHEPSQYLKWADRKGAVKMPTDTIFYHLTRMVHMSTACVGCGQCSNACPNDIPVMELFRSVAMRTQQTFGYQAGRDIQENPPMSEFREQELEEVVGITI